MKRDNVVVRAKLVVRYWELIPMESWNECSAPIDTSTVRVSEERLTGKKNRIQWWSEANWPRLKDALVKNRDPNYRGRWDVACLDLGIDRFLRQTKVHPRLRDNNLVTKYGFPEGSCVIPNKAAYMEDETWAKVVKVVAPGIRKMAVRNVAFVCSNSLYSYLTLHLCSSKLSADDP